MFYSAKECPYVLLAVGWLICRQDFWIDFHENFGKGRSKPWERKQSVGYWKRFPLYLEICVTLWCPAWVCLQTLICVLVARPRRCLTLSNPAPWQNWMVAYLGYTLRMRTLFHGWPIMVNDTHTRRRRLLQHIMQTKATTIAKCEIHWK